MKQTGELTKRKYDIGASKITFSSYVGRLYQELQNEYKKVRRNSGKKKQTILQIYSNSSNFSLIISEENRNRDHTKINIGFARVPNKELKKLENKVDETLTHIFDGNIQKDRK